MKIAQTTTMFMVWSIAAMVFTDFPASQQTSSADPFGAVASSGHRHSHEGLTWPPQPRASTNVVVRSNIAEEKKGRALEKDRIDRLEAKAKTTPEAKRHGAAVHAYNVMTARTRRPARRSETVFSVASTCHCRSRIRQG